MLEDFEYPDDCSKQSALTTDPKDVISSFASNGDKIWPGIGINQVYNYTSITEALGDDTSNCFIVGLYGYPPCTPGCYCPGGTSKSCVEGVSPFTSKRGSNKHSDCYLKSGVEFKEGGEDVTGSVKDLLGLPVGLPESFPKINIVDQE